MTTFFCAFLLFLFAVAPMRMRAEGEPRFEWRGAMLDLSRHYFPVEHIYRQIDALAACGINRLHLHLTDAAGWRMEIKAYPTLTNVAAWRTGATLDEWWEGDRTYGGNYGGYYTQEQLRALVRYADSKGVLLVPEIEMPGHSEEVFAALPQLLCVGGLSSGVGVAHGQAQADFCAGNEETFVFVQKVLDEVMDVFTAPYIHIGGDEAGRRLWTSCSRCQQRMAEHGFHDTAQMQAWFMQRICRYVAEHGRQAVVWDEVMEGWSDDDDTLSLQRPIVMCWRGQDKAAEAVARGFKVILCPGSHCYLDCAQDAPHTQPVSSGGYLPLAKVYAYDPLQGIEARQDLVLGVQGNLWAEHIATPQHAEYMLYPRIMAIAEIGRGKHDDYAAFRQRAVEQVRELRAQGYNAFDLAHEVGERKERDTEAQHMARGCKVTYNAPFNDYYRASGALALTDGIRGGWANNDGRWQGFIGRRGMDVTIDLGAERDVSAVKADFQQICQPDIYAPALFVVSAGIAADGLKEICRHEVEVERNFTPRIETREWHGSVRARYIRVQALPSDKYGGWIFCDEIVVL